MDLRFFQVGDPDQGRYALMDGSVSGFVVPQRLKFIFVEKRSGQIGLRIEIAGENPLTHLRQHPGQMIDKRRLANAALVIEESEHGDSHRGIRARPGNRPDRSEKICRLDRKTDLRMTGLTQRAPGGRDTNAVSLNVSDHFHRFRQVRIAIVGNAGTPEIGFVDATERPARILDFYPVVEPGDANRGVSGLVIAMHNRISHELLQRREGISLVDPALALSADEIDLPAVVRPELLFHTPEHIR